MGTGLANYTISYDNGTLTVNPAALTITANSTQQDLRPDGDVRRHRVHHQRPGQRRHGHQRDPDQRRAAATATVAGSPYAIVPSAAVGTGLGNYTISYVNGTLTVNRQALDTSPPTA